MDATTLASFTINPTKNNILLQFIKKYQELEVLWNPALAQKATKEMQIEALNELLKIYKNIRSSATIEDVKLQIIVMRSEYDRDYSMIKTFGLLYKVDQKSYDSKSWIFYALRFLDEKDQYHETTKPPTSEPKKTNETKLINNVYNYFKIEAEMAKETEYDKQYFSRVMDRCSSALDMDEADILLAINDNAFKMEVDSNECETVSTQVKIVPKLNKVPPFLVEKIRDEYYDFSYKSRTLHPKKDHNEHMKDFIKYMERQILNNGFYILRYIGLCPFNEDELATLVENRFQLINYVQQMKNLQSGTLLNLKTNVVFISCVQLYCSVKENSNIKYIIIYAYSTNSNNLIHNTIELKELQENEDFPYSSIFVNPRPDTFFNKLNKVLPPGSVIVMNESLYNKCFSIGPDSKWSVTELMAWLNKHNIHYGKKTLHPELYDLVKKHKMSYLQREYDYKLILIPGFNPSLNPANLIWDTAKNALMNYLRKDDFHLTTKFLKSLMYKNFAQVMGKIYFRQNFILSSEQKFDSLNLCSTVFDPEQFPFDIENTGELARSSMQTSSTRFQ